VKAARTASGIGAAYPNPEFGADSIDSPRASRYLRLMRSVRTRQGAGTQTPLVRSPVPERPQIHQIVLPLPDRWTLPDTQVHLIESDPLTLVDAGPRTPESRVALEAALDSLGYGLADIERVVLTHAHTDRMGLVQTLRDAGARLECWVHEADAARVESFEVALVARGRDIVDLFREFGVPEARLEGVDRERIARLESAGNEAESTSVERILRQGDRVEFKDFDLGVIHCPGHTAGHLLLSDEAAGLLFTGDQIMGQAIPNTENYYLSELPDPADPLRRRPRFRGLVEMRRSLRRLRGGGFRALLPGHGGVIRRADRTIRDTLLFYDVRLQRIERSLRRLAAMGQDVTAFEILKAIFPGDEPLESMMTHLFLVIGALDCLEEQGQVEVVRRSDGVLIHHHRAWRGEKGTGGT